MAEQAQNEPTMEEILSSIRKIIADDSPPEVDAQTETAESVVEEDVFEEAEIQGQSEFIDSLPETEEDVFAAITESVTETIEESVIATEFETDDVVEDFDPVETFVEDEPAFQAFEEAPSPAPAPAEEMFQPEAVAEPEPAFAPEPEFVSEPAPAEEPVMTRSAPIADDRTVDAAAGSLGKLLSKVEFGEEGGGTNTIEGVVRELLRPMLKDWLDDNLPGIVEKHVEAEVQRIARMAR